MERSDEEVLAALVAGDADGFSEFYRRHLPAVTGYFARRVADREAGDKLESVRFADGSERRLGGLLVPITLHQRTTLAGQLGAATVTAGPVSGEAVQCRLDGKDQRPRALGRG